MKIQYPCIIEHQEDGKYFVSFKDFEEAITEGNTRDEALFNAEEVLTLTLEGRMEENIDIPLPNINQNNEDEILISPSSRVQAALLVRFNRGNQTLADLARALETSWPVVARLEDPYHWSTLKQLSKTAAALGQKLVLSFEKYDQSKV
ncbi:MAG: Antitoxin HicB [Holosporales bacterium]